VASLVKMKMKTRDEVEQAAFDLGEERWAIWIDCGVHDLNTLPLTASGEHYCPDCFTIWTADGTIQNALVPPTDAAWTASHSDDD
jgi:hypothetical protein